MANWISKISYIQLTTGSSKSFTFSSAPESDPLGEKLSGVMKKNQSSDGTEQVQWSYNKEQIAVKFLFQTSAIKDSFEEFLLTHGFRGGVFNYYIHSDESEYDTYRLIDKSVKFDRPIPDGSGDFEYNFGFKMERVLDLDLDAEEESGVNSIAETQFTIANNQTSWADITGLAFSPSTVGGARIHYFIQRKHTTPNSEVSEFGEVHISYNTTAVDWNEPARSSDIDAGIEMQITAAGQFQYKSTDISGSVDTSIMRFRASTIGVAE